MLGRTGLRRFADLDLRASGRRHLHEGRGRRRRPGRQGRGGHPEDDPRQPAVIADNVRRQRRRLRRHGGRPVRDLCGDHHRDDAAGRPADDRCRANAVIYPLVLGGFSIIASIVGTFFVKARAGGKIMNALYRLGVSPASADRVLPITSWIMATRQLQRQRTIRLRRDRPAVTAALVWIPNTTPPPNTALCATCAGLHHGHGTNVIAGLGVSMRATAAPVLSVCLAIWAAYEFADCTASRSPQPRCCR